MSFPNENPRLLVFLPALYAVWSDRILSLAETDILSAHINEQTWLSPEEKQELLRFLSPGSHLTTDTLKHWLAVIRLIPHEGQEKLIHTGIRLARHYDQWFSIPVADQDKLEHMESQFGIPEFESAWLFWPEGRESYSTSHTSRTSFDPAFLTAILDGTNADIINKTKALLSQPGFGSLDSDDLGELRAHTLNMAKRLAAEGLGSLAYPKSCGGQEDIASYFAVMETLSYSDLSLVVKFGVQFGLWGMSIYLLGTERHHKKYLPAVGTLELPGCFAMTETGHGSNVRGIETTATYDHTNRTFTIHTPNEAARKEYIGNAALHGKMATVFAKIIIDDQDYGVGAFVVPLRDDAGKTLPGITIKDCGRKMGLNGVDNGVIYFDQVTIPADDMLDRFAGVDTQGKFTSPIASDNRRFFTMLGALVGGRIGIPRSGLAATKTGLTIAVRYGDRRRQFGPEGAAEVPILNYRTHQLRLIPALATTYALHFALQRLTHRYIHRSEKEMQEIEAMAAGLKAVTTWHTTATLQTCRECCGGKGYLWENRIGLLKNDSDIYTTFEGDNTVLLQLVAKARLTAFKQEFSNMGALGLLGYLADKAATSLTEMNPLIVRRTDDEHLLDPEYHLEAFTYRERDILTSAAKRLRRLIGDGMDSFDAFNVCQQHMVEVGTAYIDRIVLEEFQRTLKQITDSSARHALERLYEIFALSRLDAHKAWYLENGYMEGAKTKAIRKLLSQRCWDLRPDAVALVDGFGIPETLLGAEIGKTAQ